MANNHDHFTSKEVAHEAAHEAAHKADRETARAALLPAPKGQSHTRWDRFVLLMRLTLPVFALVAGAVTIGYPLLNDNQLSFTLSTEDVLKGDDTVHMKALKYRGTDAINRLFTVTAASGFQKDPGADTISLNDIRASIQMKDEVGSIALVTARKGRYQKKEGLLYLIGGVQLNTTSGYSLEMNGAEVYLKERRAIGNGGIMGETPLGTLSADRFSVDVDNEIGQFSGRITLKIIPKKTQK